VLYKGFKATHAADLPTSIKLYQQAKDYFQQFLDKDGDKADKERGQEQHRRLRQGRETAAGLHQNSGGQSADAGGPGPARRWAGASPG